MLQQANVTTWQRREVLKMAIAMVLGASNAAALGADAQPVATTKAGQVRGTVESGINVFKGVRYGADTATTRFQAPLPPKPWSGVVDAFDYGNQTPQPSGGDGGGLFKSWANRRANSEDCLFLNVWTPGLRDSKKRPVMVWFHGGGFSSGSGASHGYDGVRLAKRGDVVVVTVNHRLNVFGHLYLKDIGSQKFADSGNVGILDLELSLKWVRDNIAEFGGDPGNVTIMGQSGGGLKVCNLLAMPSAKGLFHKASIQSGASPTIGRKEAATRAAKALLDELKIIPGDIKALQAVPAQMLLKAAAKVGGGAFSPIMDGVAIPRDPFAPDAPDVSADVPVLIGFVKDEMTIFTAAEPWFGTTTEDDLKKFAASMPKGAEMLAQVRKTYPHYSPTYLRVALMSARFGMGTYAVADRKVAKGKAPVYMWFMTWETPVNNGIFKTPHTMEIPFMMNSYNRVRAFVGPGDAPKKMAQQIAGAWVAFARTGKPDCKAIPHWPAYDSATRPTMVFDLKSKVMNDPNGELRKLMMGA